jgi:hypothetical protein
MMMQGKRENELARKKEIIGNGRTSFREEIVNFHFNFFLDGSC